MKKYTALILFLSGLSTAYGQALDSIKYEYGHLYYHSYGKGDTIIMLAGGPGNDALQLESLAILLSANYNIVLLEQRGTGMSIPARFNSTTITLEAAISDINLLLTHLNISKAILLGHSWGANLAMIYASQFPQKVKSIVLISPGYFGLGWSNYKLFANNMYAQLNKQEKGQLFYLISKSQSNTITGAEKNELAKLRRLPYIYDKSKVDSLLPLLDGHNNEKTFQLMLHNAMNYHFNLQKDLQKIASPIYLICGREDRLIYIASALKIARPDISLYWIDQSGHFPMHEQPEQFYAILNQVLENEKTSH